MRETLLQDFQHESLTGDRFEDFVDRVIELLPGRYRRQVIVDSLTHLVGEDVTKDNIDSTCWRLAGNMARLKNKSVGPWIRQAVDEWVPAQVISYTRAMRKNPGYEFKFKVIAGLAASMTVTKFWSSKFCYYVGKNVFGFSNVHGCRPMKDPRELVSLRLLLLIDKENSNNRPGFEEMYTSGTLLKENRKVIDARIPHRRKCPKHYKCDCYLCPIGQDQCPLSVHKESFIFAECGMCREDDAPHDPEVSMQLCINCIERQILKGER